MGKRGGGDRLGGSMGGGKGGSIGKRDGGEKQSAGPGQFLARRAWGTNDGSGSRGTPRRRITEAFATVCPIRTEI